MTKIVCTACKLEYQIKTTGVYVIEYASFGPYKIWAADEHECPGCHSTILAGFGAGHIREHFEDNFDGFVEHLKKSPMCRYDFENIDQRDEFLEATK